MTDIKNDEDIEKTLREAFEPVKLPDGYRNQLLQILIITAGVSMKVKNKRPWKKPELWLAVATVAIMAIIGYGVWLPFSVWDKLTS